MNTTDPSSSDPLDRLFAEARTLSPDTASVEYALETRVLARIRERRAESSSWMGLSWKLVPFFALIVVLAGIWDMQSDQANSDVERLAFDTNSQALPLWEEAN